MVECLCGFYRPAVVVCSFEHVAYEVVALVDEWSLRDGLHLELL